MRQRCPTFAIVTTIPVTLRTLGPLTNVKKKEQKLPFAYTRASIHNTIRFFHIHFTHKNGEIRARSFVYRSNSVRHLKRFCVLFVWPF